MIGGDLAKQRKTVVSREFGNEMRSWRGHIARKQLAMLAGVHYSMLGIIEHGKVYQVRTEEVLKVMKALPNLRRIKQEREAQIFKLFRIISIQKRRLTERCCCHGRQHSVRR